MKQKKSNANFMIIILVIIVGLLAALYFSGKQQNANLEKQFPSYESVELKKEVTDFDYANQPFIGDENAPVSVVEFGDFKCPSCAQWKQIVYPTLYSEYIETGKVKFYFINLPFIAADSRLAALAGELIYQQNKDAFWQYYTELYAKQPPEAQIWGTYEFLTKFVKENVTGIDYEKFNKELKEFKDFEEVKYDFEIAKKLNVQGTPTLFVNGQQLQNPSYELLKPSIEAELAKLEAK